MNIKKITNIFLILILMFLISDNNLFVRTVKAVGPAADAKTTIKCQYQKGDLIIRLIEDTTYSKKYLSIGTKSETLYTELCTGIFCINSITFGKYPSAVNPKNQVNVWNSVKPTEIDALFACPKELYNVYDEASSKTSASTKLELAYFTITPNIPTDGSKYDVLGKANATDDKTGNPIDQTTGEPIDCSDFTDDDSVNIISEIFNIIMIVAPILALVLGGVDFAKASLQSDEKALKKAGTNFGKRIAAAIILFLLPLILNLILGIAFDAGIFGSSKVPELCLTNK